MMREKGFQFAEVTHEIEELSGGPKLVQLTFHMDEGPKVKIRNIDFIGNKAISDGDLQGAMKQNKERWFLSLITGRGTYQENRSRKTPSGSSRPTVRRATSSRRSARPS